ncbi:DUF6056 family protein [Streptomyces sp. NPDC088116]|uniref:DUF6056 family protein n=1 Tax=Streptomyces sp. NPDC088116 TaxID=3365825 RepID=UPI003804CB11
MKSALSPVFPPGRRNSRDGRTRSGAAFWTLGLALLSLGLLGRASWLGRHVRPGADEWCFLPGVRDHGIAGLVGRFYLTDNGRLGNGLLVGLYAKSGVAGHQWFGLVSGALMLGLLWSVTLLFLRLAGRTVPHGFPLLVASLMTAVFLLATPNTYKTFYWPASSVSHTMAPVLACACALPLRWARSRGGRTAALTAAFVTGCFIGTLSEETSAVSLVVLCAVVLLSGRTLTAPVRAYARAWCLTGMAGIAVGTLVLLTSPGSANRRARYGAGTISMFAPDSLGRSLRAFTEILGTVASTWQYAGVFAAGVLLGLLGLPVRGGSRADRNRKPGQEQSPGARTPVLLPCRPLLLISAGALTFLVSGCLCTVITYPLFGAGVVQASRTWNDYLLLYVLLLTGAGALLGRALRRRARHTGLVTASAVVVCVATCAQLTVPLDRLGHDMRVRAEQWDHQDRWLRMRAAHGARVLPYKPLSVGGMTEPFLGGGHRTWPAECVADYYHLTRITRAKHLP